MPSLALPDEPTNEIKLADWLEIYALISDDENSSLGDLAKALKVSSVFEIQGRDAIEEKCLEVLLELEQRAIAAGEAYPFVIDGATLQTRPKREIYSSYLFCLCLSYFQWDSKRQKGLGFNPWLLFEELSCIAAAQFVGGEVINFGTAKGNKVKAKKIFREKINELCRCLGEGTGFREQNILNRQDDHVDLIAWRNFKDFRASKLVIFGQCAGGNDWMKKDSELKPQAFWDQWMLEGKVSQILRTFYIPHRIAGNRWEYHARRAGILFDRCRVAFWAYQNNKEVLSNKNFIEWYKLVLPESSIDQKSKRTPTKRQAKKKRLTQR